MPNSTSNNTPKRNTSNGELRHHDKSGGTFTRKTSLKNGARNPSGRPPQPPKK